MPSSVHEQFGAKNQRVTAIISPLRYPGSKRRLAKYIDQMLEVNGLLPSLYVEPFAGGASVALQLLNDGRVQQIGLIEKDPLVAAFWKVVFSKSHVQWLISQIEEIEVTLARWQDYKSTVPTDDRQRALVCFYLNRTSFSGILEASAGPLGGYDQASDYPIDCRFPRETLIKRIKQANALRDRVAFVWQVDWATGLKRLGRKQQEGKLPQDVFFYFDPPFFNKAEKLYNHYFTDADHHRLRDTVLALSDPWVLSYDDCDKVVELYQEHIDPTHVELLYGDARNGGSRAVKEAILTNLPGQPQNTKLWRSAAEWKNGRTGTPDPVMEINCIGDNDAKYQSATQRTRARQAHSA